MFNTSENKCIPHLPQFSFFGDNSPYFNSTTFLITETIFAHKLLFEEKDPILILTKEEPFIELSRTYPGPGGKCV